MKLLIGYLSDALGVFQSVLGGGDIGWSFSGLAAVSACCTGSGSFTSGSRGCVAS
jgi:hypothetical protein